MVPSKIQCIIHLVFIINCCCCVTDAEDKAFWVFTAFCVLQCSVTCGEKPGTQYRNVECVKVKAGKQEVAEEQEVVSEKYCESTPKPADFEVCEVPPCTSWKHGSWGRVSI